LERVELELREVIPHTELTVATLQHFLLHQLAVVMAELELIATMETKLEDLVDLEAAEVEMLTLVKNQVVRVLLDKEIMVDMVLI
jgi:hypothetical protein